MPIDRSPNYRPLRDLKQSIAIIYEEIQKSNAANEQASATAQTPIIPRVSNVSPTTQQSDKRIIYIEKTGPKFRKP